LDYGETAQKLILRYKQLCVDFNAGLVSLAAFHESRERIEEAVAQAAGMRERMHQFMQVLKRGAFDEMDQQFKTMKDRM
ncbi:MAG: hypothetical protein KJ645_13730, partial [Planctomycetes bacterium]|nr:hypothetical protein [Planctomycetota bacterium]